MSYDETNPLADLKESEKVIFAEISSYGVELYYPDDPQSRGQQLRYLAEEEIKNSGFEYVLWKSEDGEYSLENIETGEVRHLNKKDVNVVRGWMNYEDPDDW